MPVYRTDTHVEAPWLAIVLSHAQNIVEEEIVCFRRGGTPWQRGVEAVEQILERPSHDDVVVADHEKSTPRYVGSDPPQKRLDVSECFHGTFLEHLSNHRFHCQDWKACIGLTRQSYQASLPKKRTEQVEQKHKTERTDEDNGKHVRQKEGEPVVLVAEAREA